MSNPELDRRTLVRTGGAIGLGAAAAVGLVGCGSSGSSTGSSTGSSSSTGVDPSGGSGGASSGSGASVPAAEVPVGGGAIVGDAVVTQPTKGSFKAFSVVCTHKGCQVSKIEDGHIKCPCHGSMFDIATGAPTQGPARRPLAPKTATVKGTDVVVS